VLRVFLSLFQCSNVLHASLHFLLDRFWGVRFVWSPLFFYPQAALYECFFSSCLILPTSVFLMTGNAAVIPLVRIRAVRRPRDRTTPLDPLFPHGVSFALCSLDLLYPNMLLGSFFCDSSSPGKNFPAVLTGFFHLLFFDALTARGLSLGHLGLIDSAPDQNLADNHRRFIPPTVFVLIAPPKSDYPLLLCSRSGLKVLHLHQCPPALRYEARFSIFFFVLETCGQATCAPLCLSHFQTLTRFFFPRPDSSSSASLFCLF